MIVASIMEYPDVLQEVLIAAAFLNDRIPFLLPHGLELEARKAHHSFRHKMGDFVSYLRIYRAYMDARDKETFCDRFYLDYKGMEEIRNVTRQLGEIASEIGIPLTGEGSYDNYLCAVSKGLIHYVCRRDKETSYSSPPPTGSRSTPGRHVSGEAAVHRGGGDRSHLADVRPGRFASHRGASEKNLARSLRGRS